MKVHHKRHLGLLLGLALMLTGCQTSPTVQQPSPTIEAGSEKPAEKEEIKESPESSEVAEKEEIKESPQSSDATENAGGSESIKGSETTKQAATTIQFISTGNSDCVLISNNGEYMIIDGGDNNDEAMLRDYLKKQGITRLKYVVLTHPDADHCGGLDSVIESVQVDQVFVGNGSAETKTYKDFVQAAIDKGLKPSVPLEDKVFTLGSGKVQFFNQSAHENDVNDNSLVTLYTNGDFKALFTGDAGQKIEEKLPLGKIGHVDLLKAGHHGSRTSSSPAFIKALSPEYVVICCGVDNKYGHPHKETLATLSQYGVKVYRTDLNCTVTVTQKEDQIQIKEEKTASNEAVQSAPSSETSKPSTPAKNEMSEKPKVESSTNAVTEPSQPVEKTVYLTKTGTKYHHDGCQYLNSSKIAISQEEAEKKGYTACSKC